MYSGDVKIASGVLWWSAHWCQYKYLTDNDKIETGLTLFVWSAISFSANKKNLIKLPDDESLSKLNVVIAKYNQKLICLISD